MVTIDELREKRNKEKLNARLKNKTTTKELPSYPYCPRCQTLILAAVPGGRNCRSCGTILESITLPMSYDDHKAEIKRKEFRRKRAAPIKMKDVKGDVEW